MTHDGPKVPMTEKEQDARLESLLNRLEVEKAPDSLTRRLYRIPAEQGRKQSRWNWLRFESPLPRWVLAPALAAVPVLVLTFVLIQPGQPSAAEVEQARQDLAVAFAYLDQAGLRTGEEIQDVLGTELRHTVKGSLTEHLPFTEPFRKEEST
jgi:hypothetical protein